MPGEFFFMAIGGLGVSLAGFAGLIAALTPEQQRSSAVARWRISRVVVWGLHVTLVGFGVVAVYALLEDASQTARVASAVAALLLAVRTWRSTRPGPAWPNERDRRATMALWIFEAAFALGNVAVGSVGYLHVIMLVLLAEPAAVFVSAVQEATGSDAPPSPG
ncbi:MAG TPA: hypothetical protein VLA82_13090 [Actinomycetota bacterium]|nr:hypothetical protein [Actinomycetota bacterium]